MTVAGRTKRPKVGTVLIAALLALLLALLGERAAQIAVHFSSDPNEGWNAFQATRALSGAPLYPAPGSLIGNNYPPLSFYVVGLAGRLLGDMIVAGRLVALAAMLVTGLLVMRIAARLAGQRSGAPAMAGLLFLGFGVTLLRRYVALDDPQWLATALMAAGLLTLLPRDPDRAPSPMAAAGSALLLLTGGLVKHNLFALPLAAALWLLLHHRRAFLIWCAAAVLGLLVAAGLAHALYGPDFFADLLNTDRHFSLLRMVRKSVVPVLALAPAAALSITLLRRRRQDRRLDLVLLYAAIAVPVGIVQRGGQGVDVNAHFEAAIALSITASVAIARWSGRVAPGLLLALALAPIALIGLAALPKAIGEWRESAQDERIFRATEARIARTPGAAVCEMPALCFWAGKGFALDFFLYGQKALLRHDEVRLRQALDAHRFGIVELDPDDGRVSPGDVPNPVPALLAQSLVPLAVDPAGRRLLVPAR
jgi:hypothetical protein